MSPSCFWNLPCLAFANESDQRFPFVGWSAAPAGNENTNRSWMTQHKQNSVRSSRESSVWRDDLRVVPKIWDGTAPVPPASADHLEQFFRLRVLMFGAAIELQIVETAIVAGFGQQL